MLQVLFIGLKLANVIDWTWFWVFWITCVVFATLFLTGAILVCCTGK